MSSTNKTNLGLNQWALSDKPTMHDFNADNALLDELLTGKADDNWRVYTSLEELCITPGSETIDSIFFAMRAKSTLILRTGSIHAPIYPSDGPTSNWGTLELTKNDDINGTARYTRHTGKFFVGTFEYASPTYTFSGWREVVTTSNDGLAHPVWHTLTLENKATGSVRYSRIGGLVTLRGTLKRNSAANAFQFGSIPEGYRCKDLGYDPYFTICAINGDAGAPVLGLNVRESGQLTLCGLCTDGTLNTGNANDTYRFHIQYWAEA